MLPALLKAMRPRQWVKQVFVVAPLVFAKGLGDPVMGLRAAAAFAAFSAAASAIYLLNDLSDVEADREHPTKRHRPIASGALGLGVAKSAGVGLALLAVAAGAALGWRVAGTVAAYLALNVAYTFRLKRIPYLDVLSIAAGFELRVLTGAYAIGVEPSNYLLVVTLLVSGFLGFGKRMHELKLGSSARAVLQAYDARTLSVLLHLLALATTFTYVVYTLDPQTRETFGTEYLPVTIVFVEFGVLRFLGFVQDPELAESPTDYMLRDPFFLGNGLLWLAACVTVIYLT
ncbi:MAG: decaprenyl-phosphate phosphoribosyltransferase [Myxococcota bacterium]